MKTIAILLLAMTACGTVHETPDAQVEQEAATVQCFFDPSFGELCPSDGGFFRRNDDAAEIAVDPPNDAGSGPETEDGPDAMAEPDAYVAPDAYVPQDAATPDAAPETVADAAVEAAAPVCLTSQGDPACGTGTICKVDPHGGTWCCAHERGDCAANTTGIYATCSAANLWTCMDTSDGNSDCCAQ